MLGFQSRVQSSKTKSWSKPTLIWEPTHDDIEHQNLIGKVSFIFILWYFLLILSFTVENQNMAKNCLGNLDSSKTSLWQKPNRNEGTYQEHGDNYITGKLFLFNLVSENWNSILFSDFLAFRDGRSIWISMEEENTINYICYSQHKLGSKWYVTKCLNTSIQEGFGNTTRSQMLWKVESVFPAKLWRLVRCIKMVSKHTL